MRAPVCNVNVPREVISNLLGHPDRHSLYPTAARDAVKGHITFEQDGPRDPGN